MICKSVYLMMRMREERNAIRVGIFVIQTIASSSPGSIRNTESIIEFRRPSWDLLMDIRLSGKTREALG